jgi:hypothetical protein
MCAWKETDVRESPNDSTLAGGQGQGGHGETCHLQYRESPVSSVTEHPLYLYLQMFLSFSQYFFLPLTFYFQPVSASFTTPALKRDKLRLTS